MDYLAAMRAFVRAVDLGSFSKAAGEAGLKVSTVSRYVSGLEADLGAALLNRSTRQLHLTEAGEAFHRKASAILHDVEAARASTMALNADPQGVLRITMPGAFGRLHVVPHMKAFRDLHPKIRLDLSLTDTTVNLIESGADVAVRIGVLADSALVARQLAPHRRALVASPAYLAGAGPLPQPHALQAHECLMFALQPADIWYFSQPDSAEPTLAVPVGGGVRANDSEALLHAARAGLGVALLPTWLLGQDIRAGRLVRLLPDWDCAIAPGPKPAIWGVYPPKKRVSPKLRAFLTFLAAKFGTPPYWDTRMTQPSSVEPVT